MGVSLDELIVYGTKRKCREKARAYRSVRSRKVDIITFTSPSTVTSFVRLLEDTNWREWTKNVQLLV